MRKRLHLEHGNDNPLKHGLGGLLDIEFIAQLGVLLTACKHPDVLRSTEIDKQLQSLRDCGWINTNDFRILADAHTRLSRARQYISLVDDSAHVETASLLGIARALCDQILR